MGRLNFLNLAIVCTLTLQSAVAAMPTDVAKAIRNGDFNSANQLLIPLAEKNDIEALYQLGRLQQRKLVANASRKAALKYFLRAAELGHVESSYLVARELESGTTVDQDIEAARMWLVRAANAGHNMANERLKQISNKQKHRTGEHPYTAEQLKKIFADCDAVKFGDFVGVTDSTTVKNLLAQIPLALHKSIDCDSSQLLTHTIDTNILINHQNTKGDTALHLAVSHADAVKVRLLLKNKASTTIKNEAGWSARMLAERSSNPTIRKIFGITQTTGTSLSNQQLAEAQASGAHKGWSKLSIAAWKGDLKLVQKLVVAGENGTATDSSGFTPIYRAIEHKKTNVLEYLLATKSSNIDVESLKLLAKSDNSATLSRLISHGLKTNLLNDSSLLHIAISNNASRAAALLIKHGANTNKARNNTTPLIVASQLGNLNIVQQLIDVATDLNSTDQVGCTALCWAIKRDYSDIAVALLAAGSLNTADKNGLTPLMLASQAGWLVCVEQFIASGENVLQQSHSGSHALILASRGGHKNVVALLLRETNNVDLADKTGDTALISAVREDHQKVAQQLIASGASINAHNNRFESAKMLAMEKSDKSWKEMFEQDTGFWSLVTGSR